MPMPRRCRVILRRGIRCWPFAGGLVSLIKHSAGAGVGRQWRPSGWGDSSARSGQLHGLSHCEFMDRSLGLALEELVGCP